MADDDQSKNLNQIQVSVSTTTSAEIWLENLAVGNFNPGTKEGAAIFKLKTKNEHNKKIELTKSNAQLFWSLLQAKEPSFGRIISKIPIKFNANGDPTKHANMISEYTLIEMKTLQRNAISRFSTRLNQGAIIPDPPFEKRALNPTNVIED